MAEEKKFGFGFSPLSNSNREHGFPEEITSVKSCGLFGIMDHNGNVISGEYIARSKAHLERFVDKLLTDITLGKIYKITTDDNLVRTIMDSENIFTNSVEYDYDTTKINGFRFDFDLDLFVKSTSGLIHNKDIEISIDFSVTKGDETKTFNITESIVNINSRAYKIDYSLFSDTNEKYKLEITSIKIIPPSEFNYDIYTIVLHDILLCIMGSEVTE